MKKVAILQSNYIPWKGYFDLVNLADEFVLYDDMQYTRRDWRNRNRIKTPQGLKWLTIPVEVKGKYHQKISETRISGTSWSTKHWQTLTQFYSKAPHYKVYANTFEDFYSNINDDLLSEVNFKLLEIVSDMLGISTRIRWSSDFELPDGRTERLMAICQQVGATTYLSGPAAKEYLDMRIAEEANVKVEWMCYANYPKYSQLYPPFEHGVTILDLLFNEGLNAKRFLKSFW
jgi:hypothetical protein